ncbi:hypothetical protein BGZ76_000810 [Entomortierella beljakovae]|nr:hypothetical protein BGZ76_000810 [Entomortierella beljakovae]
MDAVAPSSKIPSTSNVGAAVTSIAPCSYAAAAKNGMTAEQIAAIESMRQKRFSKLETTEKSLPQLPVQSPMLPQS